MPLREDRGGVVSEIDVDKEHPMDILSERVQAEKRKEGHPEHVSPPVKPYKPPVQYPQRLVKATKEHKYGTFLEMLKKFHNNIPFLEAINNMPSYAKFLKDFLSNKKEVAWECYNVSH